MDKKHIFVFLLIFAIAIFSVVVMAEETEDIKNTTEQDMTEAEIMHIGYGATVRLLQLEKSMTRNILYGEHVLEVIEEKKYNISTDRLEELVDELKAAKEDLASMIEKINETTAEDAVDEFVALKSKAINLTQEFRTIIKNELTIAQRQEIKGLVDKKDFSEVEKINKEVVQAMRKFNRNRTMTMLQILGINDSELLDRIETGNITTSELRHLITDEFKSLNRTEKKGFLDDIKEERKKVQLLRHEALGQKLGLAKQEMEKVRNILNDDSTTFPEKKAKLEVYAQEQIRNRTQEIKDKINNRIQDRIQNRISKNGSNENGKGGDNE